MTYAHIAICKRNMIKYKNRLESGWKNATPDIKPLDQDCV